MSRADRLHPAPGTAVLRRYRTGSGDGACWLLAVSAGEQPRYCVLDDRTLLAPAPPRENPAPPEDAPAPPADAATVTAALLAATGGRVDLLAATVLGAAERARASLDGLEIAELWLPWTEDPADPAACRLRRDHAAGAGTLRRAADRLDELDPGNAAPGGAPSAADLRRVADALPAAPSPGPAAAAVPRTGEPAAGDGADDRPGDGAAGGGRGEPHRSALLAALASRVRFRRAGDASDDALLPGLRLRVLAPADDEPDLAAVHDEPFAPGPAMAEPAPRFSPGASLFAAALADPAGLPLAPEDRAVQQLDRPFDRIYSIPYEQVEADPEWGPFFRQHYGFADRSHEGPAWRRVDADWLGTAAQLAFQLATETRAAALAVALELGGRTLRFPPEATPATDSPWTDQTFPLT